MMTASRLQPRIRLRLRLRLRLAALAIAGTMFLASCTGGGPSIGGSDPAPTNRKLEHIDLATINLPSGLGGADLLDPGWDLPPRELDGVYVGQSMSESGWLEFTAVDETGEILWLAKRPPSCTGFALARTESGRPLAILTNLEATSDAIATPSATAFDLHTGDKVWGPVAVTGPYRGPGLVFAAAPQGFMGDTGKKIVLHPSSGEVLEAEDERMSRRIVGEFQETLIGVDAISLTAERMTDEGERETLWSLPLADLGGDPDEIANLARNIDLGSEYLSVASGKDTLAVLELETGRVVDAHARSVSFDKQSNTLVVLNRDEVVGVSSNHGSWRTPIAPGATIRGVGGGLVYITTYEANVAIDLTDGTLVTPTFAGSAPPGTGPFLPTQTTKGGATIVEHGTTRYLLL